VIEGIAVSRFRGILRGSLEGLKQVTVIVGRNGAGKSSILEALYLASSCASALDEVRRADKLDYIVSRRGGRGSWNGSRSILWHMGDIGAPIEIQLKVRGEALRFVVLNANKESRPVRLAYERWLVELENGSLIDAEKLTPHSGQITIGGELAEMRKFLRGILLVDNAIVRAPSDVESYAWPKLLPRRLDKDILGFVREELEPEAEGLTYVPSAEGYYYLALQTAKTAVRVEDLGDGVRNALLTAMLVLAYRPTLLLIEEPELHMHPSGLYTLTKFLVKLSKNMGFQIIATTHSIEFVQIAETLAKELGVEFAALYVEREEGILRARSFSADDHEILRKLGIDIRLLHRF